MPAVLSAILPVLAALFILIAGNGIINTLTPLRANLEGFSQMQIGFIGSAFFIGMLAGTFLAPGIVRRAGHIRAFAAYAAIAAVAVLAMATLVTPWLWAPLRAIIGFALAGLFAIMESWVSSKADSSNRGRMLALYNVVNFAGSATGQQTLRFADPKDFQLFSASAMFMMASLVPMAMTRAEPPPLPPKGRLEIAAMIRMAPVAAIGIAMVGWANGTFWSLAPAFVERLGIGTVASFMTAVILGSAAGPYPLGRLSDRIDRRIVIAGSAAAAAVIEAALVWSGTSSPVIFYAFGFAIGLSNPVLYPLLTAHAIDRMGSEKAVAISSTLLFLYCVGAITGPLIASWLMVRWGDPMLFVHNAAVHALMAAFVFWRIMVRAPAVRIAAPEDAEQRPPAAI